MNKLALIDQLREQARFYISTPERATEALLFIRNLERFTAEIKEKVKERAVEVMDRDNKELLSFSIVDPETGEVREWEARRSYSTVSKEYRSENVIRALGEKALPFLKVSKTALDRYIKKASFRGEISMEQVESAVADPIEKTRKGAGVIIKEINKI